MKKESILDQLVYYVYTSSSNTRLHSLVNLWSKVKVPPESRMPPKFKFCGQISTFAETFLIKICSELFELLCSQTGNLLGEGN